MRAGLRLPLPPLPQGRSPENGHRFNFVARMQHEHRRAEPSNGISVATREDEAIPLTARPCVSAGEQQLRVLDPRQHPIPGAMDGRPHLAGEDERQVAAEVSARHLDPDAGQPRLQLLAGDLHLEAPRLTWLEHAVESDCGTASTRSQPLDVQDVIAVVVQGEDMPEGLVVRNPAPAGAAGAVSSTRAM